MAVIGESGSGKSTLARLLSDEPGVRTRGTILADGRDIGEHPSWYRERLGYVSQDEAVHRDLTALQAVQFSCLFRGRDPSEAEALLSQVDLREERRDAPLGCLSGGESKRVRIASELANAPGLLVLDEAASGLDWEREKALTRLLRTLSDRGCTIVTITHNLRQLDAFDRVVVIRAGQVVFVGTPAELREQVPTRDLSDLDLHAIGHANRDEPQNSWTPCTAARRPRVSRLDERWRRRFAAGGFLSLLNAFQASLSLALNQARNFWRREVTLLGNRNCRWKRLALPLVVLPLCFALAISCALKPESTTVLGFLSILSCIWMGASLSLMGIADEREVFDHERLLFLRIGPYMAAKTVVVWLMAVVQTVVFVALLTTLRAVLLGIGGSEEEVPFLYAWPWALAYLALVAMAGTGVGLLLSAVAGRNRPVASFLLPLVMIVQIVFSVQIAAEDKAKDDLHICYGGFHVHQCQSGSHAKGRRAEAWAAITADRTGDGSQGGWFCADCREKARGKHSFSTADDALADALLPNLAAASGSYLTISRYADIALRSFAYFSGGRDEAERFGCRQWRLEASWALVSIIVGLPLATAGLLFWQNRVVAVWSSTLALLTASRQS